jgi:hypothetical protein
MTPYVHNTDIYSHGSGQPYLFANLWLPLTRSQWYEWVWVQQAPSVDWCVIELWRKWQGAFLRFASLELFV